QPFDDSNLLSGWLSYVRADYRDSLSNESHLYSVHHITAYQQASKVFIQNYLLFPLNPLFLPFLLWKHSHSFKVSHLKPLYIKKGSV
ncbi:MAG: hypothetical protein V7K12_27145, partial [Nostoc sp.]